MGLLDGLLGNAAQFGVAEAEQTLAQILLPGERVDRAYRILRDAFVFTDSRLILIDRQGITGSKVAYQSIPYKAIRVFSVETAGAFDLDSELKIWVAGLAAPIQKQFRKGEAIFDVQTAIAHYVKNA